MAVKPVSFEALRLAVSSGERLAVPCIVVKPVGFKALGEHDAPGCWDRLWSALLDHGLPASQGISVLREHSPIWNEAPQRNNHAALAAHLSPTAPGSYDKRRAKCRGRAPPHDKKSQVAAHVFGLPTLQHLPRISPDGSSLPFSDSSPLLLYLPE